MKYQGSKARIASKILPIMLERRKPGQWWVEPFVGGGNMISQVTGFANRKIGTDANPYAIQALTSIRDRLQYLPRDNQEFTEEDYRKLSDLSPDLGYKGFALSYGGKWMGGWSRDKEGKRDYVREAYNNAARQSPLLQDVVLFPADYMDFVIPSDSLIYCDPPYAGTTGYKGGFDTEAFWEWARQKAQSHTVFISEYAAPDDFQSIWSTTIVSSLTKATGSKVATEHLFIYRG